jgi:uncharacterized membrane protein YdjX (TVP38/TMEM64 family)
MAANQVALRYRRTRHFKLAYQHRRAMPQPAPIAVPMEALLADSIEPLVVGVLLAGGVGLGLPCGALVVLAGALFGSAVGLLTVVLAQAIGLSINWHLCRGVLRPRLQRWLAASRRGRRLERLLQRPASLGLMVLLRLALIPMALVNAACALSPTAPRRYALACVVLLPRFALMVCAGDLGAAALRGSLSPVSLALRLVALGATGAALLLLARGVSRQLRRSATDSGGSC